MATVVKINSTRDNFTLYIGRAQDGLPASKWQNPYHINGMRSRTDVLTMYEDHIRNTPRLWASLYEIDGQVLGCWCHNRDSEDGTPTIFGPWCHGDVLIKLRQEQLDARQTLSKRSNKGDPRLV
jgi:hypothetical protein